ncbi:hypothetical protein CEXT_488551 [Caerostris extrusa]|uniref:Uncharacterized protein n=1 Tax=Caerostris extrusa TaxID=172846 RepID=A0AAV4VK92_CAEEX|nr:hypothetical protein CEXT_488551 [Caerostris extrusa]
MLGNLYTDHDCPQRKPQVAEKQTNIPRSVHSTSASLSQRSESPVSRGARRVSSIFSTNKSISPKDTNRVGVVETNKKNDPRTQ